MKDESQYLAPTLRGVAQEDFFAGLTERQRLVAGMLVCGYSQKEIVRASKLSEYKVHKIIHDLFSHFDVLNTQQLIARHFGPLDPARLQELATAYDLSKQEEAVLDLITQGLSFAEIAQIVKRQPETISAISQSLSLKFGAHRRFDLPLMAHALTSTENHIPQPQTGDDFFDTLTPREREITGHLLTGATNKQIASRTGNSHFTIADHIKIIFSKLRFHHREGILLRHFGLPDQAQFQSFADKYHLTKREQETLLSVLSDDDKTEAASAMGIGRYTYNGYLKTSFQKCGIHGTPELFMAVHSHGAFREDYADDPVSTAVQPALL